MSITVKIDLYQFLFSLFASWNNPDSPTFPLEVGKTTEKIVYFECADSQPNSFMFGLQSAQRFNIGRFKSGKNMKKDAKLLFHFLPPDYWWEE